MVQLPTVLLRLFVTVLYLKCSIGGKIDTKLSLECIISDFMNSYYSIVCNYLKQQEAVPSCLTLYAV